MRNAKQILQASLKDINDGRWICGELCTAPENHEGDSVAKKDMMGCALGLVSIWGDDTVTGTVMVPGVPNPNWAEELDNWFTLSSEAVKSTPYPAEYSVLPRPITAEVARYADADSPKPVIKAIKALYAATPKNYQKDSKHRLDDATDEASYIQSLNEVVYEYNDGLRDRFKTKKGQTNAARRWFEAAIRTLPGVDASLKTPGMLDTTKSESLVTIL